MRVLVAYASRHGSTKEVAERIAVTLRANGVESDTRPAEDAREIQDYGALVLGSPVYNGSWLPEALDFVRRSAGVFSRLPVWIFSIGSFGDRHPVLGSMIRNQTPRERAEIERTLRPREHRAFAGVIERSTWPLYGQVFYKLFGGRFGDCRDWPAIDAWAEDVARQLTGA